MTLERRTYTVNNGISVVSLVIISSFHLIGYQRFRDGSCHSVAMVRIQVTKVICLKKTGTTAKMKDWLIMFIAVVSRRAGHGGKPI